MHLYQITEIFISLLFCFFFFQIEIVGHRKTNSIIFGKCQYNITRKKKLECFCQVNNLK